MSDVSRGLTYSNLITVTPVLTVHANYANGDYVGTSAVAMTLAGAARVPGGWGHITHIELVDYALQSVTGELWIFTEAPTPPADSAAWTISDADALKCIGVANFATYYASALNSVAYYTGNPIGFECAAGSVDLYACFVTRGAPALASGDLSFRVMCVQD